MSEAVRSAELFRGRTVLIMIIVGVLAFAALAVLSVYAPTLRDGDDGGAHPLSKSAVGFAGITRLLRDTGETVVVSRDDTPSLQGQGLLILTPNAYQDVEAIKAVPFAGRRLVILPKWSTGRHPVRKGWVAVGGTLPERAIIDSGALRAWSKKATIAQRDGAAAPVVTFDTGRRMTLGQINALQTMTAPGLLPVLTDDKGRVLMARTPDSKVYILADPDLMNTMGIKQLATARAAAAIVDRVRPYEGPLVFDVSLHGFKRSRDLFTLALEPPFLGGTLCAVAAALLAGIAAAVRFGPVRRAKPPYAMGKEALVENTAGLIRMARREHRMAEGYARLCRDLAARAVGAPRQLDAAQLDAFLDRLSAQRGAPLFTDLIRAAREAGNLTDLMAAARKLYDWRLEMTRASR